MFQVGLPCHLGLTSGRSVSINVNKTRKRFSRNINGARMFPQCFPVSHAGNCFQCQFLFPRYKLCFLYTAGNFNENLDRACQQLKHFASTSKQALILFYRAIRAKAKFCEHFQIGWTISLLLSSIKLKRIWDSLCQA